MDDLGIATYWAGLPVFARLVEGGAELSSPEMAELLGTRSVKGIGASLSGTRRALSGAGIRLEEAVVRRTVRRRSVWKGGPRLRQAMHVLEQERYRWTGAWKEDDISLEDALPGDPVLVLRALMSQGNAYRFTGGMAELDEVLDGPYDVIGDSRHHSIGEVFISRIEPGRDGKAHPVPDGYGGKRHLGAWRTRLRGITRAGSDRNRTLAKLDRLGRRSHLGRTEGRIGRRPPPGGKGPRGRIGACCRRTPSRRGGVSSPNAATVTSIGRVRTGSMDQLMRRRYGCACVAGTTS